MQLVQLIFIKNINKNYKPNIMKSKKNEKKQLTHLFMKMCTALLLLFVVNFAYAQERTLQGLITDESKTPILGANVVVKGTTTGTVSDTEGKFTLKVPSGNTVIVVSYIGYQPQEIRAGDSQFV